MNIVIATGIYPPDIGGPATYVPEIAKALTTAGHNVTVVTYSEQEGFDHPDDDWNVIRVARQRSRWWKVPLYTLRLFVASLRADLLFSQSPVSVGISARLVAWLLRKPLLVKIVGDVAWERGQTAGIVEESIDEFNEGDRVALPLWVRLLDRAQRRVARGATRILVPSKYLKSLIRGWGVSPERISVIYNAVDIDAIAGVPEQNDASNDGLTILSVGRLVPWKCFVSLTTAVATLYQDNILRNTQLIIMGSGPDREHLADHIKRNDAEDYIHLVGSHERSTVIASLKWADIFVLNSTYEGLSHQLLEACAAGVAIIATDAGGNPEVIEDGVNGLLVPPHDEAALKNAIVRLAHKPKLRRHLAQQCRLSAGLFSHKTMIKQTLRLLEEMAMGRGKIKDER